MSTTTIANNDYGELQVSNRDLEALMSFAIKQIDNETRNMPQFTPKGEVFPALAKMAEWRKLALLIADVVEA